MSWNLNVIFIMVDVFCTIFIIYLILFAKIRNFKYTKRQFCEHQFYIISCERKNFRCPNKTSFGCLIYIIFFYIHHLFLELLYIILEMLSGHLQWRQHFGAASAHPRRSVNLRPPYEITLMECCSLLWDPPSLFSFLTYSFLSLTFLEN